MIGDNIPRVERARAFLLGKRRSRKGRGPMDFKVTPEKFTLYSKRHNIIGRLNRRQRWDFPWERPAGQL